MTSDSRSQTGDGLVPTIGHWLDRYCHVVYVVVALPLVIWFACWMPAFQNPDEWAHFSRADQISRGVFVGERFGTTASGGWTDKAIAEDRKSTRLNSSHIQKSRMPSSA